MTDDEAKRIAQEIDADVLRRQPVIAGFPPRERVLEIARYLVGTGRIVEPTGRNDGVPRFLFMSGDWDEVNERGLPWCAGFVLFCFARALHAIPSSNPYELRACSALFAKAKQLGVLLPRETIPSRGDVVFLWGRRGSDPLDGDKGIHHCGIVEDADAMTIYSIEGNWSNKLARVSRANTDPAIAGYARF